MRVLVRSQVYTIVQSISTCVGLSHSHGAQRDHGLFSRRSSHQRRAASLPPKHGSLGEQHVPHSSSVCQKWLKVFLNLSRSSSSSSSSNEAAASKKPFIPGALTEENLVFLEAWRVVDRAYVDKSFNGQSWFRYRENALKNTPMVDRDQTYAAIRKMLASLDDPFTRFLEPEKLATLRIEINPVTWKACETSPGGPTLGYIRLTTFNSNSAGAVREAIKNLRNEGASAFLLLRSLPLGVPSNQAFIEQLCDAAGSPAPLLLSLRCSRTRSMDFVPVWSSTDHVVHGSRGGGGRGSSGAPLVWLPWRDPREDPLKGSPRSEFLSAAECGAMMLDKGVIVYIADSMGVRDIYDTEGEYAIATEEPLAVLVNKGTASASEILAGALKDNKRATILGQPTFGKGAQESIARWGLHAQTDLAAGSGGRKIQSVFELSDGSGLAVTIARYETPSHIDIDKVGITPDKPLPDNIPINSEGFCSCIRNPTAESSFTLADLFPGKNLSATKNAPVPALAAAMPEPNSE
eukprot:jgi/Mesen1/3628/ME000020S03161